MQRLVSPILVLFMLPALAIIYFVADARYTASLPCPFYYFTHLFCPGCGSQRAFSALVHGEFMQAVRYNSLFVASLPVLLYSGYCYLKSLIKKIPVRQPLFYSTSFSVAILVVVIAYWIVRNIPGYPFNLLAPHVA